jgi:flagellar secretion chaperone FliS
VLTRPYQRYVENSLLTADPMQLVVELYQGTLNAVLSARRHNAAGEPMERGAMINRAIDLLSELTLSLNVEAGGDLSKNLKELYGYMQHALLDAHARQSEERLNEVAGLLSTLLEAWRAIADQRTTDYMNLQHQPLPGAALSLDMAVALAG